MTTGLDIDKWFGGDLTAGRKSAVRNVIGVMLADGKIDPREKAFLKVVCNRVGITRQELADLVRNPAGIEFVRPKDDQERAIQMCDMVFMMLADGEIDRRELEFCMVAAQRLGFHPKVVPELTAKIIANIKGGRSQQRVTSGVADFLRG